MWLTGRPLVGAMCIGQLGNLLPHVTVPAIMVQSLMPLWGLNATEAGVMASGLAVGYMLAVPILTTLRPNRRTVHTRRWFGAERPRHDLLWHIRGRPVVSDADLGSSRGRVRWRVHAGAQGAN